MDTTAQQKQEEQLKELANKNLPEQAKEAIKAKIKAKIKGVQKPFSK